ncbi:MAG: ATP-binding domain-containing protein, partial [Flavobacteriales bacterium]|nr:ATP-binding domain-containing protein [Flavobacteriales bacterium]
GDVRFKTGADFVRLKDGYDIQSAIEGATGGNKQSEAIIITRSNKRAALFNSQIRSRIKLYDGEICTGDLLMVVKNNYFWVEEDSVCGFIANGDLAEVMSVRNSEIRKYGMRFARVELRLVDYPQMQKFEALILLDTIYSDSASLNEVQSRAFYEEALKEYDGLSVRKKHEELSKDEFYNAIQVKFGYAVTCHKSQGGGWDNVFIEQVWMSEQKLSIDYLRWLYTAITRAREKVYLIGFSDDFFEE